MKKILLFLIVFSLTLSLKAEGLKILKASSLEEAIEISNRDGKFLMVEMFREKCPACVKLETLIFPSDIVGNTLNPHIYCYRIDGEKGVGIDIMKKYRGVAFPTLLFFKDGSFIERSIGAGDGPEAFVDRIKILLVNYDIDW